MHHSQRTDLVISILGGFVSSLTTFLLLPYLRFQSFSGQLVAGNPNVNRQYPSTLNTMQAVLDPNGPTMMSVTSSEWWIAVTIGSIICAAVIFRLIRRVV